MIVLVHENHEKKWTNVTQAQHFCSGLDHANLVILSMVPNIFSRQTDRPRQTDRWKLNQIDQFETSCSYTKKEN